MQWITALFGAFFGAAMGDAGKEVLGAIVGLVLGWHFGRHPKWSARLRALEDKVARLEKQAVGMAEPGQPRVTPAVAPAPPEAGQVAATPPPAPIPEATSAPLVPAAAGTVPATAPAAARMSAEATLEQIAADAGITPPAAAEWRAEDAAQRAAAGPPGAAREAPSAKPAGPREPDPVTRAIGAIKHWFTEGNVPVKVGVIVLFFAVAASIKYAVDQGLLALPIEVRMAAIAAGGVAALVFGWRQRTARPAFALALQGGALGVLLLTVFASYRLYHLLPAGAAFALVLLVVAGAAVLAVLQHALALAVLGFVGGFLAPVLIQTGSADHVALFSYYAVLNAAIFVVAWLRPWRPLNLVGFAFTFIVGLGWGRQFYRPELFASVEPFLILFFLFYVFIAVAYALREPGARRGFVDATLVFGTPLVAFPLQAAMVDDRLGLAYSAVAVGALYAGLCAWLIRREGLRLLGESFAALALGFITLAVPLALSARWTSGAWAMEGAALVWLGQRQGRKLPLALGLLLELAAGGSLIVGFADQHGWVAQVGEMAIVNGWCFGALLVALAGFWCARRLDAPPVPVAVPAALTLWGSAWWAFLGQREINVFVPDAAQIDVWIWYSAATVLLATALRRKLAWPRLSWPALIALWSFPFLALVANDQHHGVLQDYGAWAWLTWAIAAYAGLKWLAEPPTLGLGWTHVMVLATLALVPGLQLEASAQREQLAEGWHLALPAWPLLALGFAIWRVPAFATQPLADRFGRYAMRWHALAGTALALWWLLSQASGGAADPIAYLPVLNPLELTQIAVLVLLAGMMRARLLPAGLKALLLGAAFVELTMVTLRGVHHLSAVPWGPSLLDSMVAQASLTVVWSLVGMLSWIWGSKRRSRAVWRVGALLMAVVLAKLALVDRHYTGDLPGIVSFFAFGVLCLIVGYIAPSPPKQAETTEAAP